MGGLSLFYTPWEAYMGGLGLFYTPWEAYREIYDVIPTLGSI